MATVEGDIDTLSRAIMGEARVETEELRTQARARADAIRQQAQVQSERERKMILDEAHKEADRIRGQALASAQLKARALELEQRERLLDQVFDAAAKRLQSVLERKDYEAIVIRLLSDALLQLNSPNVEVRADPVTQKSLTSNILAEASKDLQVQLSMGKTLEDGTGLVVLATDGHLHVDSTLETRLARLRSALRPAVYRVLMGETR